MSRHGMMHTWSAAEYADRPPDAPWCAVLCRVPEQELPRWFDQWTKTLAMAMALVGREGW